MQTAPWASRTEVASILRETSGSVNLIALVSLTCPQQSAFRMLLEWPSVKSGLVPLQCRPFVFFPSFPWGLPGPCKDLTSSLLAWGCASVVYGREPTSTHWRLDNSGCLFTLSSSSGAPSWLPPLLYLLYFSSLNLNPLLEVPPGNHLCYLHCVLFLTLHCSHLNLNLTKSKDSVFFRFSSPPPVTHLVGPSINVCETLEQCENSVQLDSFDELVIENTSYYDLEKIQYEERFSFLIIWEAAALFQEDLGFRKITCSVLSYTVSRVDILWSILWWEQSQTDENWRYPKMEFWWCLLERKDFSHLEEPASLNNTYQADMNQLLGPMFSS